MSGPQLVTFEQRSQHARVLVVTNGWPNERDQTYCVFISRQVSAIERAGVECDVLFIRGYRTPLAYVWCSLYLLLLSFRRRYELVHAHGGEAALAARFYWRAPLLVSYLGQDILGAPNAAGGVPLRGRVKRWIIRQQSRVSSATITKSGQMQTLLPSSVQERNHVVPNGVDLGEFRLMTREASRVELGWPTDAPVALFVARPTNPRKRVWLAEEGVSLVRREFPDARLEIASGVAPEQIPIYMNAADCLVLPSSSEGSPNVVKEALMCNLPVVATAVGDIAWLLDGVEPSYLVAPTGEAIAEALRSCFAQRRRSNGRAASAHLSGDAVADRVVGIYGLLGVRSGDQLTSSRCLAVAEDSGPVVERDEGLVP